VKAAGVRQVYCVHVHLCEEWCGRGDDGWDRDLAGLSELANVAGPYVPGYIMAHVWPPEPLQDEGIGHIESAVSSVVMCHYHHFYSVIGVKYLFVGALGVALPEDIVVHEEAAGVSDNEIVLMVVNVWQLLEVD